jgi:hypothetical protein
MRRRGIDKREQVELANAIFNLSSYELNETEKSALNKGLKYGIKAKRVDTYEILARFEMLAQSLNSLPIAEKNDIHRAELNPKNNFLSQLQSKADEFLEISKKAYENLSDEEYEAITELAKNKSLVISKADKGNAVVILDASDYRRKVSEILNDDKKFKRLDNNVTRLRERKLQEYMRTLSDRFSETEHSKINPCGSRAGVLYGLPKIHKDGTPIRPIISAVKTYNYGLAKHLDNILKPLVNDTYMLKDTYDFVNKVKDLNINNDRYVVSFDVESLFTNVPTTETIEHICDLAFANGAEVFNLLTREELHRLLIICTQESHFQFNGEYFDQIDGVAMGSPLGPLFANIFMSKFEREHMPNLRQLGVVKWFRYVDDIFATLNDKQQADAILKYLNERHGNIRFTIEHEQKGQLPFLDTCVVRRVNKYITTIYRKKTFTGVYLNWTSLTARRYKIGLIRCLAERIWRICSVEGERNNELSKLKTILRRNDYPQDVIDKTINLFLESKTRPTEQPVEPNKRDVKRFLKLPYTNKKCEEFAHDLKKLVETNYQQVEFNVAYQAPMSLGKLFPFKDNVKSLHERSLVVYSIKCNCGQEYIGKTERILYHRLKEHASSPKSACKKHKKANESHEFEFVDVQNDQKKISKGRNDWLLKADILDAADNDRKLRIKELLHILQRGPELNKQLGLQSRYEIKTLIIKAHPHLAAEK